VQDRSANELPAQTQTLRGHNSAPQATQTLQFRLNRSPQPGENTYAWKPRLFCDPAFS